MRRSDTVPAWVRIWHHPLVDTFPDDDDDGLGAAIVALRPCESDAVARALEAAVRRDLVGTCGDPFRLGRFTAMTYLGSGGMGSVFVAYDPDLDRKIALKVLHTRGERGRREVLREGRALARLRHPGVVAVYEVGVLEDQVFVAMEYASGPHLRAWLREPRAPEAILSLLVEAGRGLVAAHDAGLVHLDFKPENIVVDERGRARVIDFGLARSVEEPAELNTSAGASPSNTVLSSVRGGTPAYMAPERLAGAHGDHRSDQFSFCLTCWEALFGHRPRAGEAPPAADGRVSPRVVRALRRGMSVAPEQRFASMHALLAELEARPARRSLWSLGALAAAALVIGVYAVGNRDAAATTHCPSPWHQVGETWNEERVQAVGAAFDATGVPFARETSASVGAALGRYARAWADAHADACKDGLVDGVVAQRLFARRLACLEDRRLHFAALVERFAVADVGTVTNALAAVERLPPIDRCGRTRPTDAAFTDEPDHADERMAIRGMLARASAEMNTGRPADAALLLDDVLTRAQAAGSPVLLAEALVISGQVERMAGHADVALERAREALSLAVAEDDPMQAGLAALLVAQIRHARGDSDNADLLTLAAALSRRAGQPPQLETGLLLTRGTEYMHQGRFTAAVEQLERARAFAQRHDQRRAASVAMGNIGWARDQLGDVAGGIAAARQAITELESLVGSLHPWVASFEINVGSSLVALGDYDEAVRHLERARAIITANFPGDHSVVADALFNIARTHEMRERFDDAFATYQTSLEMYERLHGPDHPSVALALCGIGEALGKVGRHDEALAAAERVAAIQAKALPADHCHVLACETGRGATLHALGRVDDALRLLTELSSRFSASDCTAEDLGELDLALARSLWSLQGPPARDRVLALLASAAARVASPGSHKEIERLRAAIRLVPRPGP